jgi:hypothetical protein
MMTTLFLLLASVPATWQNVSEKQGLVLQAREVEGQPYPEYMVSGTSTLTVEEIDKRFVERFMTVKDSRVERTMLEQSANRIVFYDRIKAPIVSDRDYVLEFTRNFDEKARTLTWSFKPAQTERKPCDGCVRMPAIQGSWTFSGAEKGSKLQYVVYSDPGGSVPKGMVVSNQKESSIIRARLVLNALER